MKPELRINAIEQRLRDALAPQVLEVKDESHLHVGHAGAADGRGHFRVMVVTEQFDGCNRIARHRAIYQALDDLMQTDIHALAIEAYGAEDL